MIYSSSQDSISSIISSGEHIYVLAKNKDLTELGKQLPEYTRKIEQYFIGLDKKQLTHTDFESLNQVMVTHKKVVKLINKENKKVTNSIKQLQIGKEMQNTYPQTF